MHADNPKPVKDYLWLHLRDLPYFRGLLRAVEARFYQDIPLTEPVLDLGCGDGHFATLAFDKPLDVGIDPWSGPVHQAGKRGGYLLVLQGSGERMPFQDNYFGSVVSNSVLEHIPDLDSVLCEVARVIQPGGLFVFCVPNHQFLANLSISSHLDRLGLRSLGDAYRAFFNRISRHHHCDGPQVWEARLQKAGFRIERRWHYFSPAALHVLEWGHYLGLPSLVCHFLTGRWILIPTRWNLSLTRRLVQPYYDELAVCTSGAYSFYIAKRK